MAIEFLSREMAFDLLEQIVAERGAGYIYKEAERVALPDGDVVRPKCVYVETDDDGVSQPSCGVGLALVKAGIPADAMDDEAVEVMIAQNLIGYLHREGFIMDYDSNASAIFNYFQTMQDDGMSWGEALSHVKADYGHKEPRW